MTATHNYAGVAAWNFKLKAEIKNYDQAKEFLRERGIAATGFAGVDLGPQMIVWPGVQYISISLYDTEIIRYYPDNTFSVDNGGFNTITTTERLQTVLPDGFRCYHFSTREIKGKLGLMYGDSPWPKRRKVQTVGTLWPLDHSKRITMTGDIAS